MYQETIDGTHYRLLNDGSVDIQEQRGQRLQLAPEVLYSLAVFLQRREVRLALLIARQERQHNED